MSLSCKIIPSRFTNITLCFVILMLCFFGITFLTGSIFGISLSSNNSNVSALTYSTEEDISFTFAPSLSITLSDTDLVIDTLAPGNTAESNTITVSVASNTPYGYTLYADVGSNDTSSKYYNTSDLIRDDNGDATFTSIATNASLTTLITDNTWGYSTSLDNGTTWSTYNGLPTATSTIGSTSTSNPAVLIDTKLPADNQSIALKVAARSSTTQASGTYSNIINFYAVGKPQPPVSMQDTDTIRTTLINTGDEMQVMDNRDEKTYLVAKLADNNIWMTQNLDFDIVNGGANINSTNTDVPIDWADAGRLTNTYAAGDTTWSAAFTTPESYDPGNLYWNGKITDRGSALNRGTVTDPSATSGGVHYHIGNYYNWTAAVAMNDSSSYSSGGTDVNQSICPAGWKLPASSGEKSYQKLIEMQGLISGASGNMHLDPTYFVYNGVWNSWASVGNDGGYWSSGVRTNEWVYAFSFGAHSGPNYDTYSSRSLGYSVRCILR